MDGRRAYSCSPYRNTNVKEEDDEAQETFVSTTSAPQIHPTPPFPLSSSPPPATSAATLASLTPDPKPTLSRRSLRKRKATDPLRDEHGDDNDTEDDDVAGEDSAEEEHEGHANTPTRETARSRRRTSAPFKKPSTTKGALDSRKRNESKDEWQGKVRSVIDSDIVDAVDQEKGMNPAGRTLKAAYDMINRQKEVIADLEEANETLKEENEDAWQGYEELRRKIGRAKHALRD